MLECQEKWWKPSLDMLGWHIGFWNLVGGLGFTLCGALGFGSDNEAVAYASALATFVGSWAFLVSICPLDPYGSRRPVPVLDLNDMSHVTEGQYIRWLIVD